MVVVVVVVVHRCNSQVGYSFLVVGKWSLNPHLGRNSRERKVDGDNEDAERDS